MTGLLGGVGARAGATGLGREGGGAGGPMNRSRLAAIAFFADETRTGAGDRTETLDGFDAGAQH